MTEQMGFKKYSKKGTTKLSSYCHSYMMQNVDEVQSKPELCQLYLKNYIAQWRGKKAVSTANL